MNIRGSKFCLKNGTNYFAEINNFGDHYITGGVEMDQDTADQSWQQLQAHIQGFLGQFLSGDTKSIEYKPQFTAPMLEMPSAFHQSVRQELA